MNRPHMLVIRRLVCVVFHAYLLASPLALFGLDSGPAESSLATLEEVTDGVLEWPSELGATSPDSHEELPEIPPIYHAVQAARATLKQFLAKNPEANSIKGMAAVVGIFEKLNSRVIANRQLKITSPIFTSASPTATDLAAERWQREFESWQWGLEHLQTDMLTCFSVAAANFAEAERISGSELKQLLVEHGAKAEAVSLILSVAKDRGIWHIR